MTESERGKDIVDNLSSAVDMCKKGNLRAYRTVVDSIQSKAIRFAYHILGNYLDAEDAVQEAFLQAWRRLDSLKETRAFLSWFFQILANTSKRKMRKARQEENLEDYEHYLEDQGGDPAGLFQMKERRELLKGALSSLPFHYRSAVILRDVEGFSYAEIAGILQIPEGTVKSRIAAARESLRVILFEKEGKVKKCRAKILKKN